MIIVGVNIALFQRAFPKKKLGSATFSSIIIGGTGQLGVLDIVRGTRIISCFHLSRGNPLVRPVRGASPLPIGFRPVLKCCLSFRDLLRPM